MSLPILHSIVGVSIVVLCYPRNSLTKDWKLLLFAALIAVSPDLDYLLVYGLHMSYEYHRSFTHSVFVAPAIALLILIANRFSHVKLTLVYTLVLLSHGILDFLVSYEKDGVKLLYPLSDKRFEFEMIEMFERTTNSWQEFINQASLELIIFTPILLILLLVREFLLTESALESENY
ncbi:MAG TPA: metal-dependent hydrolase [Pyrinomonadaceae bacterium]|jgi:membrane-bound metal-dependent hydrolase YbcI (DUF457 family)